MALSKKPLNSNMGQPRGQSSGWAAFDRMQREKQGSGPTSDSDPFPSITSRASSSPTKRVLANHCTPARTYSAVPPSLQFPLPTGNYNGVIPSRGASEKNGKKQISTETIAHPVKLLSKFHSWADQSLIEDILAAVNNDVDQASILLRAMVSPDAKIKESTLPGTSSSSSSSYRSDSKNKLSGESGLVENKSNAVHHVLISSQLISVPVEPEWEEDDVYLSHRKDAIKMIRMASQHSRAANNAFLRGDHDSAQHHSSRARDGWTVAQKLNAEASTEILRIRNINNGMWKIDLHGLHATEAVDALKDHLHKIESQTATTRHPDPDTDITASLEALSCLDADINVKENNVWRNQRPSVLEVITGRGNHSREEAALPIAVRSFLIENGYRFEDVRPGVIGVRPKFRYK